MNRSFTRVFVRTGRWVRTPSAMALIASVGSLGLGGCDGADSADGADGADDVDVTADEAAVNGLTCESAEAEHIIADNADAPNHCPQTCARVGAKWNKHWTQVTYPDREANVTVHRSVCGCCTPTFKNEPTTRVFSGGDEAIVSNQEAPSKCNPTCESVGKQWSGQWATVELGGYAVCGCTLKAPEQQHGSRHLLFNLPAMSDVDWSGYSHVVNRHTEYGANSQGNSIFAQVEGMGWYQTIRNLYQTGTMVEGNDSGSEMVIKLRYAGAVGYTAFGVAVNYVKFVLKRRSGRWYLTTAYPVQ